MAHNTSVEDIQAQVETYVAKGLNSAQVGQKIIATATQAAAPQLINYQGRLTDNVGNPVADGSYSVVFTIHDAAVAGTSVWTETHISVTITNGLFNVLLGTFDPLIETVFTDTIRSR